MPLLSRTLVLAAGVWAISGCDRSLGAQAARDPAPAAGSERPADVPAPPGAGEQTAAAPPASNERDGSSPSTTRVALVELFTSEGCSSCPPADEVLSSLERTMQGRRVVTLSFHVDYWNELGWPDPWSSPRNTARQEQYARALGGRGLYTPQMIVNGKDAFIGSDAEHARESVQGSLARALPVALEAEARRTGGGLTVAYRAHRVVAGVLLHVAIAERRVQSRVPRGENAGRTLSHTNVVRAFQSLPLERGQGELALPLPPGLLPERALVVTYLQKRGSMEVLGATVVDPIR